MVLRSLTYINAYIDRPPRAIVPHMINIVLYPKPAARIDAAMFGPTVCPSPCAPGISDAYLPEWLTFGTADIWYTSMKIQSVLNEKRLSMTLMLPIPVECMPTTNAM
jgi:hypothetical protein